MEGGMDGWRGRMDVWMENREGEEWGEEQRGGADG